MKLTLPDDVLPLIWSRAQTVPELLNKFEVEGQNDRLLVDRISVVVEKGLLGLARSSTDQAANLATQIAEPRWLQTLRAVFPYYQTSQYEMSLDRCVRDFRPIPFQELLVPFVKFFRDSVFESASDSIQLLTEESLVRFERQLLSSLSHWFLLPLFVQFQLFSKSTVHDRPKSSEPSSDRRGYCEFVNSLFEGGIFGFFGEYSFLARLAAEQTENSIDSTVEFLQRFASDAVDLQILLQTKFETQPIAEIECGLSDPHCKGRRVIVVTTNCGTRFVYKPRSIEGELAFQNLLATIEDLIQFPFPKLRALAKGKHGWVEFAKAGMPDDRNSYFQTVGAVLGLSYLLSATDLHHENVITTREGLVIIDLEALFQPSPQTSAKKAKIDLGPIFNVQSESVLKTGLLPVWQQINGKPAFDVSGLGAEDYESDYPWYKVHEVNTDAMRITFEYYSAKVEKENPSDRTVVTEQDFPAIVRGFSQLYGCIAQNTATFEELLQSFSECRMRHVARPTRYYSRLLQRATQPSALRTGLGFFEQISPITNVLTNVAEADRAKLEKVVEAEIIALYRGDIPYFSFQPKSTEIQTDSGDVIPAYFRNTGWDTVSSRVSGLSEEGLRTQLSVIEAACHSRFRGSKNAIVHGTTDVATIPVTANEHNNDFLSEALALADEIVSAAKFISVDSCTWVKVGCDLASGCTYVNATDLGLYDGQTGIAFFLSAAFAVSGNESYRQVAIAALNPILTQIESNNETRIWEYGFGWSGTSGLLLALSRIAANLKCTRVSNAVQRLLECMCNQKVPSELNVDVMSGCAGAILAFCELYTQHPNVRVCETVKQLAEVILEKGIYKSCMDSLEWDCVPGYAPLNGFAHGSAGIGLSLLCASKILDEPTLLKAYDRSIRFENSTTGRSDGIWLDLREDGTGRSFRSSWCHGVSGIGMSRILAYQITGGANLSEDAKRAVRFVEQDSSNGNDGLCCGVAGKLDFMIEFSNSFGCSELASSARTHLSTLLCSARTSGGFRLFTGRTSARLNPSFFQGVAGIGYIALRAYSPISFPTLALPQVNLR